MITARRRVGIERVRGNCRIMSLSQTSWSPIKYVEVFIGIEDARSILLSTERSDIKTVSVPLSCIFQRSRINVHQLAGSFLFTEMPHLWQRASFDLPWWRCCSEGGILHNWRRWEGQYNKSYPSVCYSCKLTAAPFKVVFFVHNWNSTMHHKMLSHYTAFVRQDLIAPTVHRCHTNGPNWSQQSRCTECKTPPA